jgi:hypothetical protein
MKFGPVFMPKTQKFYPASPIQHPPDSGKLDKDPSSGRSVDPQFEIGIYRDGSVTLKATPRHCRFDDGPFTQAR